MAKKPSSDPAPAEVGDRLDLIEDVFATAGLEAPAPITLRGVDAEIRRSYSGEEVLAFRRMAGADVDPQGILGLIAGEAAGALWSVIETMPVAAATDLLNRMINLAGLASGKVLYVLPPSKQRPAGRRPSSDSDDISAPTSE